MNLALVGSSGYIASFLLKRFSDEQHIENVLKIDQNEEADIKLNLLKPENFNYEVLDNIDLVIFTAAISGPDKCATDFEWCWSINVVGTSYFISEAIKRNCKVLFFSSDAVFGDIPGYIYDEYSETKAETPYGKMKKAIEDKFKKDKNFKAVRLSYVASASDRFISYCIDCMRKESIADIFHPFYRNVVTVSDVVDVVIWFTKNWNTYEYYVLNVAGRELVSRVRMADEINRYMGDRLKYVISVPTSDFYQNRPRITQMRSLFLKKYDIIEDNTFSEKIKRELYTII